MCRKKDTLGNPPFFIFLSCKQVEMSEWLCLIEFLSAGNLFVDVCVLQSRTTWAALCDVFSL